MRLVKGGLAEKAGLKCELNIHTATRNDHKSIGHNYIREVADYETNKSDKENVEDGIL